MAGDAKNRFDVICAGEAARLALGLWGRSSVEWTREGPIDVARTAALLGANVGLSTTFEPGSRGQLLRKQLVHLGLTVAEPQCAHTLYPTGGRSRLGPVYDVSPMLWPEDWSSAVLALVGTSRCVEQAAARCARARKQRQRGGIVLTDFWLDASSYKPFQASAWRALVRESDVVLVRPTTSAKLAIENELRPAVRPGAVLLTFDRDGRARVVGPDAEVVVGARFSASPSHDALTAAIALVLAREGRARLHDPDFWAARLA